jgi:hypothetical protein
VVAAVGAVQTGHGCAVDVPHLTADRGVRDVPRRRGTPDLDVDLVERFYGILAIVAIAAMVFLVALRVLAVRSDRALDAYARIARRSRHGPSSRRGWSRHWRRPEACTSRRWRSSPRARCAGTSASRCTRSCVILGVAIVKRDHRAPTGSGDARGDRCGHRGVPCRPE